MKLDPGIHIVMHSVLSLKPGVTAKHPPVTTNKQRGGKASAITTTAKHPLK